MTSTILNIFLFIVTYAVGLFAGSFVFSQLLIIVIFGIPISIKFRKCGILQSVTPIFHYLISFAVISVIAALITIGVYTFLPKQFWGYLLGILFPIVISLNKLGHNYENLMDFVENNRRKYGFFPKVPPILPSLFIHRRIRMWITC